MLREGNDINRNMKWGLWGGLAMICLIIFFLTSNRPDGSELFRMQGCINCHSFKGKGGEMAPDLTGVTKRRRDGWIRDQIRNPLKHNPDSRMPSFDYLSRSQITAIITYLHSGAG